MANQLYRVIVTGWVIKRDEWDWTIKDENQPFRLDDFIVTPRIKFKKVQDIVEGEVFLKKVKFPGPRGIGTLEMYVEKETYDQMKEEHGDVMLEGDEEGELTG